MLFLLNCGCNFKVEMENSNKLVIVRKKLCLQHEKKTIDTIDEVLDFINDDSHNVIDYSETWVLDIENVVDSTAPKGRLDTNLFAPYLRSKDSE